MTDEQIIAKEALRMLSILHTAQRPSDAKELIGKFVGTAVDYDSYESWRIALLYKDGMPVVCIDMGMAGMSYSCPNCRKEMPRYGTEICPNCGQVVKWDEWH